jgi:hypothetical protein
MPSKAVRPSLTHFGRSDNAQNNTRECLLSRISLCT